MNTSSTTNGTNRDSRYFTLDPKYSNHDKAFSSSELNLASTSHYLHYSGDNKLAYPNQANFLMKQSSLYLQEQTKQQQQQHQAPQNGFVKQHPFNTSASIHNPRLSQLHPSQSSSTITSAFMTNHNPTSMRHNMNNYQYYNGKGGTIIPPSNTTMLKTGTTANIMRDCDIQMNCTASGQKTNSNTTITSPLDALAFACAAEQNKINKSATSDNSNYLMVPNQSFVAASIPSSSSSSHGPAQNIAYPDSSRHQPSQLLSSSSNATTISFATTFLPPVVATKDSCSNTHPKLVETSFESSSLSPTSSTTTAAKNTVTTATSSSAIRRKSTGSMSMDEEDDAIFPPTPIPSNPTIGPNDVLCGRGGLSNHHQGNILFRKFVRDRQDEYLQASKSNKAYVAREIVDAIRKLDPPGRFLKKVTKNDEEGWIDIGNRMAREKTSQALRERAPERREELKMSTLDNDAAGTSKGPEKEVGTDSSTLKQKEESRHPSAPYPKSSNSTSFSSFHAHATSSVPNTTNIAPYYTNSDLRDFQTSSRMDAGLLNHQQQYQRYHYYSRQTNMNHIEQDKNIPQIVHQPNHHAMFSQRNMNGFSSVSKHNTGIVNITSNNSISNIGDCKNTQNVPNIYPPSHPLMGMKSQITDQHQQVSEESCHNSISRVVTVDGSDSALNLSPTLSEQSIPSTSSATMTVLSSQPFPPTKRQKIVPHRSVTASPSTSSSSSSHPSSPPIPNQVISEHPNHLKGIMEVSSSEEEETHVQSNIPKLPKYNISSQVTTDDDSAMKYINTDTATIHDGKNQNVNDGSTTDTKPHFSGPRLKMLKTRILNA